MPKYSREELNAMSQRELDKAYRTVRRNLLRNVRGMERKGAIFDRDMRPEIPKNITAGSVLKLQQMNDAQYRASHATVKDKLTGKEISWEDYERERRKASARKGARTKSRKKEVKVSLKYVNILDTYIRHTQAGAGSGLKSRALREEAKKLFRSEVTNTWERVKAGVAKSDGSFVVLERIIKSAESSIADACQVIIYSSSWEEIEDRTYWLREVVKNISKSFSAFSMDESQNIMGGGGFTYSDVSLPF